MQELIDDIQEHGIFKGASAMTLIAISVAFAMVASALVLKGEPLAGGSGIPELKAFLNGTNLPRHVRVKTLVCKSIGIVFSVAAGLPLGKEGPMIHCGAIVAAALSQGKSKLFGMDTRFTKTLEFRNDHEKRDFIACGAAAGISAAFGAPIGGTLFALEEGASFWKPTLTWRTFFCASLASFTVYASHALAKGTAWGSSGKAAMFALGTFEKGSGDLVDFSVWELGIFVLMGVAGGVLGGLFNRVATASTIWRDRNVRPHNLRRLAEVVLVTALTAAVMYGVSYFWGGCRDDPSEADMEHDHYTSEQEKLVEERVRFHCAEGKFNPLATLALSEPALALKQLLHDPSTKSFPPEILLLYFLCLFPLTMMTYGTAVPAGLFIPALLNGAVLGRLTGTLLHDWSTDNPNTNGGSGYFAPPGLYALVGSAAMLGGCTRMVLFLTVTLLEATGNVEYGLPLILTLLPARWVGNIFNSSIYDIHIVLRHIPFLEHTEPEAAHRLTAATIMAADPICFSPWQPVGFCADALMYTEHDGFPVVDEEGHTLGLVLRKVLCELMARRQFKPAGSEPLRPTPYQQLEETYPRYASASELKLSREDRECYLDLIPYMTMAPLTVQEECAGQRVYQLFRTMGLRQLIVTDVRNRCVGIITRKDLQEEYLHVLAYSSHFGVQPAAQPQGSSPRRSSAHTGAAAAALHEGGGKGKSHAHRRPTARQPLAHGHEPGAGIAKHMLAAAGASNEGAPRKRSLIAFDLASYLPGPVARRASDKRASLYGVDADGLEAIAAASPPSHKFDLLRQLGDSLVGAPAGLEMGAVASMEGAGVKRGSHSAPALSAIPGSPSPRDGGADGDVGSGEQKGSPERRELKWHPHSPGPHGHHPSGLRALPKRHYQRGFLSGFHQSADRNERTESADALAQVVVGEAVEEQHRHRRLASGGAGVGGGAGGESHVHIADRVSVDDLIHSAFRRSGSWSGVNGPGTAPRPRAPSGATDGFFE